MGFEQFVFQTGYAGLFLASVLSASALPLSASVFVVGMPMLGYNIWLVGVVSVLGGYTGGATTYYIGRKGSDWLFGRWFKVEEEKLERARRWFARWGIWALLLAAVPLIGDALCATAGILHIRFWKFSLLSFVGKGWHYVVLLILWWQMSGG